MLWRRKAGGRGPNGAGFGLVSAPLLPFLWAWRHARERCCGPGERLGRTHACRGKLCSLSTVLSPHCSGEQIPPEDALRVAQRVKEQHCYVARRAERGGRGCEPQPLRCALCICTVTSEGRAGPFLPFSLCARARSHRRERQKPPLALRLLTPVRVSACLSACVVRHTPAATLRRSLRSTTATRPSTCARSRARGRARASRGPPRRVAMRWKWICSSWIQLLLPVSCECHETREEPLGPSLFLSPLPRAPRVRGAARNQILSKNHSLMIAQTSIIT